MTNNSETINAATASTGASSTAQVPTSSGSKYMQQLCKHWSHNLDVAFDAEKGVVQFPRDARGADWPDKAVVTMIAHPETLECRIDASVAPQLEHMKGVLARHLDRFAFREAPLPFIWQDVAGA
jgi:hypothetical protein